MSSPNPKTVEAGVRAEQDEQEPVQEAPSATNGAGPSSSAGPSSGGGGGDVFEGLSPTTDGPPAYTPMRESPPATAAAAPSPASMPALQASGSSSAALQPVASASTSGVSIARSDSRSPFQAPDWPSYQPDDADAGGSARKSVAKRHEGSTGSGSGLGGFFPLRVTNQAETPPPVSADAKPLEMAVDDRGVPVFEAAPQPQHRPSHHSGISEAPPPSLQQEQPRPQADMKVRPQGYDDVSGSGTGAQEKDFFNPLNLPTDERRQRGWGHSVWESFLDLGGCCHAFWCPCLAYGHNKNRLNNLAQHGRPDVRGVNSCGGSTCIYCFFCFCLAGPCLQGPSRTDLRARYRIRGNAGLDLLIGCFCYPCELVQELKEIEDEEEARMGITPQRR